MKQHVFIAPWIILILVLVVSGYCQNKPEEDTLKTSQQELNELKFKTEIPEEIAPAGFLGIFITSPQVDSGAEVDDIVPGSPAAKAGIKKGDIILEINGEKVTDEEFLVNSISKTKPGASVSLKIRRNSKNIVLTMQTTVRPESSFKTTTESWITKLERFFGISKNYLGIKTCDIVSGLDEYFGIEEGALITEVFEASRAEKLGIKPGDVIIGIDEHKITDSRALRNVMRKKRIGSMITIKLIRHKKTVTIKGILANE
jgi:serine protease Do